METIEITLSIRQANRSDFIAGDSPSYGTIFFLKSAHTPGYWGGPYKLTEWHVSSGDFKQWLEWNMVYIPCRDKACIYTPHVLSVADKNANLTPSN